MIIKSLFVFHTKDCNVFTLICAENLCIFNIKLIYIIKPIKKSKGNEPFPLFSLPYSFFMLIKVSY